MRILFAIALVSILSCSGPNHNVPMDHQGLFTFSEDLLLSSQSKPPLDLVEAQILCKGKGMKVAKCISDQLKKGTCLGIVKEGRDVYVVEIECNTLNQNQLDSIGAN